MEDNERRIGRFAELMEALEQSGFPIYDRAIFLKLDEAIDGVVKLSESELIDLHVIMSELASEFIRSQPNPKPKDSS